MKRIITPTFFTILYLLSLGVAGSLAAADINNIRATVYSWQEAWQSKDINRYKLFYSEKFKSDGFDFQGWMNKKENIFAMPGTISVELFDLEISMQNNRIVATFIQRYKSSSLSDVGEKKLVLVQSDDMYKIVAEKFAILKEPTPSDKESLFGDLPHQTKPVKLPVPKYPASPTPVVKRSGLNSTINLTKLNHATSFFETMQVISDKDEAQSVGTQKGEWQRVISLDGSKGWINLNMTDRDASFNQKKVSHLAPKVPESKVEEAKLTGIKPAYGQQTSGTGQKVISKTSLEWLYQSPTSDSKKTERLTEGKVYLAVKRKGDWVGLKLEQGDIGWTHKKNISLDTIGATFSPKTMSKSANKPSKPSVSQPPPQKSDRTAIRSIELVTPKVSFARAYEKPTIDSIILFRLKQDKRYILIETHGDWLRIEDDNGMIGWGHRTLFKKKVETADVSVAIDRKETAKPITDVRGKDVSDLIHERTPERKSALASNAVAPDTKSKSEPSSEQALTETPSESGDALNPFVDHPSKEPETTDFPQDEPPLFPQDGGSAIAPEDDPKEIKPAEAEPSSDENATQLTIKSSNQLTPTVSLVRVYAKPSTDARIMFWLTKGKTYTFKDKQEGWYHIQLADGRAGWAHLALYIDNLPTKNKDKKKSKAVSINKKLTSVVILGGAHEKPALDSNVIFRLGKGATYMAEKKQGSWYLIKNDNGEIGWAHKSLFDVNASKPIGDAKGIKLVNNIRFEAMPTGEEKVLFSLSGFYPPNVFLLEESQSTLICDFSDIQSFTNLKRLIDINQRLVKRIRTEKHKDALRVAIDLTPGKSYDVRQVFFKKENLFTLIFSTNEK